MAGEVGVTVGRIVGDIVVVGAVGVTSGLVVVPSVPVVPVPPVPVLPVPQALNKSISPIVPIENLSSFFITPPVNLC